MVTFPGNSTAENHDVWSPDEVLRLTELKRAGALLASYLGARVSPRQRGFLLFREADVDRVKQHLATLSPAPSLTFEITELMTEQALAPSGR
jgi:hypothetical protein